MDANFVFFGSDGAVLRGRNVMLEKIFLSDAVLIDSGLRMPDKFF